MKNIILVSFLVLGALPLYAQKLQSKGRSFNPAIGVNALFQGKFSKRNTDNDGFALDHLELQFNSDVDSYFTSWILLGIEEENGEHHLHPEEAYIETISLPSVTLRVGKSKLPLGKHNQLHKHTFPFINAPLVNKRVLGEEGLAETGVGGSYLTPLPWFSEIDVHYVQGKNETLFNSNENDNKVGLVHVKNLWSLSEELTFEWGISGARGKNSDGLETGLYGTDLTFKWRPLKKGKYRSFEWGTEWMRKNREGQEDGQLAGLVSHLKYQLARRWYIQYRYDYVGLNEGRAGSSEQRHTLLGAFLPSEFSALRAQYEHLNDGQAENEKCFLIQANISIGAHPAHAY